MNDDVATLSHTSDIDGVGAAALVRMRYRMPLSNMFFTGYSAEEVFKAEERLGRLYRRGLLLFITDLVPESDAVPIYERIVKNVNANGGKVVFLDHHPWSSEAAKRIAARCLFATFGENRKMCATELVRRYLRLNGAFARKFARIVHHSDFYIQLDEKSHGRLVKQYAMHIAGVNAGRSYDAKLRRLRHMVAVIDSRRLIDGEISDGARRFEALNSKRIESILRNNYMIAGRIAVAFSKQVDSTDACMELIREKKAEVGIVVNLDHSKASIRSVGRSVVGLANAMGGGGHPRASAFNIRMSDFHSFKTSRDKQRFVAFVESKAKRAGLI